MRCFKLSIASFVTAAQRDEQMFDACAGKCSLQTSFAKLFWVFRPYSSSAGGKKNHFLFKKKKRADPCITGQDTSSPLFTAVPRLQERSLLTSKQTPSLKLR